MNEARATGIRSPSRSVTSWNSNPLPPVRVGLAPGPLRAAAFVLAGVAGAGVAGHWAASFVLSGVVTPSSSSEVWASTLSPGPPALVLAERAVGIALTLVLAA